MYDCFYDPSKRTGVTVDASPVGLGAILSQFVINGNERIVAYASRSLSKVEQRYSQTEKEALGAVFGCAKFQIYLIGINFELDTDHKPLEVIYHPKAVVVVVIIFNQETFSYYMIFKKDLHQYNYYKQQ